MVKERAEEVNFRFDSFTTLTVVVEFCVFNQPGYVAYATMRNGIFFYEGSPLIKSEVYQLLLHGILRFLKTNYTRLMWSRKH